jgi:hypothetical protein
MTDQSRPSWGQPRPGEPTPGTRPKLEGKARSDAIKGCSCFTVIIAGVVIGAIVLFSGGSRKPASAAVTVAAAPATSDDGTANPVETPPAPTTAAAATATVSTPPPATTAPASQTTKVATWYTTVGKADIETLTTDVNTIAADDRRDDMGDDLQADCVQLDNDMYAMQSDPVIPNAWAQLSWSSALTQLHQGWWSCNGGFSDNSTSEVSNAVAEIESAGPLLTATTQRVHQAGG